MNPDSVMTLEQLLNLNSGGIGDMGVVEFLVILSASLLSSWLISLLYLSFYGSRATGSQIHRSFPLLGLSVTAIFICIQFSLPLSLGLLGALSIVRFRTPIKEPEEIGFIMVVIGSSIAVATFSMYFLLIFLCFVVVALVVQKYAGRLFSRTSNAGLIIFTVASSEYQKKAKSLHELLSDRLEGLTMESVSRSGDNSVISFSFRRIRSDNPMEIQNVITDHLDPSELNLYFNKQATL
jgi:hypothetical protein